MTARSYRGQCRASCGGHTPAGQGGGEPGGLAGPEPPDADLRHVGAGFDVGGGPAQLVGVKDGDGDEQAHQADTGAGGFLAGGLQGPFPVGQVAGGFVAPLRPVVGLPERGGVDLGFDDAGGLTGGQRPVQETDAFRVRAWGQQPGQDVGVHLLAGGLVPGPADRGAGVVPVVVEVFLGHHRSGAVPVQPAAQIQPGTGGQPGDVAAAGRVERGPHDRGELRGAGPAEHGQPAAAQGVLQPGQGAADLGQGLGQVFRFGG
jgi:hypothetical protein